MTECILSENLTHTHVQHGRSTMDYNRGLGISGILHATGKIKWFPPLPIFRSSGRMTLCLHDRVFVWLLCVCVSSFWYTLCYILVHNFFIGLYLFNTATDHVHFCHACTLRPGLYSPNVFGDAALINYANLCKICQSVNILVYTFLHFGIQFFTFWYTLFYILVSHFFISLYLFNTATDRVYFWHACTLGPGLYSPNVFGDAALINYANLCKICQSVNILVYTFLSVYIFLIQQLIRFIFGMHVHVP